MYVNPFQISLETLIGASQMLGHRLEDRSSIREQQDRNLLRFLQEGSSVRLSTFEQLQAFTVAPLDFLVSDEGGQNRFHLIEINGTGIGGLTNLSGEAVSAVLEGFAQYADAMNNAAPLILVASSGLEDTNSPRKNKLIHEKLLFAEALKRGFEGKGQVATVTTMTALSERPLDILNGKPTIVLGYMKEFLGALQRKDDGRLYLFHRPVNVAVNDRFCLNVLHQFSGQVDLKQLGTMNRIFQAGADKGVAYNLLNDFLDCEPNPIMNKVWFERAHSRDTLIQTVVDWVEMGRRTLIKPQGTGLGHGIEFFLETEVDRAAIVQRIDRSLADTEGYYGLKGGALPYTVCEFIDTRTVSKSNHPLKGHKFELRVVVYRDGMMLKAFPSIAKISSQAYDAASPSHMSLINNITTSATSTKSSGTEFMIPLCDHKTLELLGIATEELREVCAFATRFLRFVIEQSQTNPQRLGLPVSVTSTPLAG